MSLFQCENCGCMENTFLTSVCTKLWPECFDWENIEDREGKKLCSACAPIFFRDGTPTKYGVWHNKFNRIFLPMGEFSTNDKGNLEHTKSGDEDFEKYEIKKKG